MKTEEAHQLANKGRLSLMGKNHSDELYTPDEAFDLLKKYIPKSKKYKLSGILSAQENEIEFLDNLMKTKTMSQGTLNIIGERFTALQISCKDLRRVLK